MNLRSRAGVEGLPPPCLRGEWAGLYAGFGALGDHELDLRWD